MIIKNSVTPFLFGLGMLTVYPNHYECYNEQKDIWEPCTRSYICDEQLDENHYRPVKDDEYLDNWVSPDKLDLTCEPGYRIGLIGTMYFIGIISTMLIIPVISDKFFGRKVIFITSILIFTGAYLGLILSTNLYEVYVFQWISGAMYSGVVIVGLSFLLEYIST